MSLLLVVEGGGWFGERAHEKGQQDNFQARDHPKLTDFEEKEKVSDLVWLLWKLR